MSSISVRSIGHNRNSTIVPIITANHIEVCNKPFFRPPKTVQEKVLCYSLCCLFITVMVFLAALCIISERWKTTLSKLSYFYLNEEDVVCETEACKESAQRLLSNLDPTTDPCTDFYQYACGGWIEKNPIPENKTSYRAFQVRIKEVEDAIVELVEGINPEVQEPRAIAALRMLYQGCRNKKARSKRGLEPLAKLLKDMGGWPMVEGPDWNGKDYIWYQKVAETTRKLYLEILLKISFVTRLEEDDKKYYMLYLRRGGHMFERYYDEVLFHPTSNVTQELIDSIAKAALMLGSKMQMEELREEARKLIIFEYGLSILGNETMSAFITIKELDENATQNLNQYSSFTYKELLNSILKSNTLVTDETEVFVDLYDHFIDLPGYIDEVDPRLVANYIGYYIAYEFSAYVTEEFWTLFDESQWYGQKACIYISETFMPNAIYRLYIDKFFTKLAKYDVNKMIEMIRLAYSSTLDQNSWMDKRTMYNAIVKLQNILSTVGYPDWIADDRLLDEHYKKVLDIQEDDYFGAILQLCIHLADEYFKMWNKTIQRNDTLPIAITEVNAFYAPRVNYMGIPAGILGFPFYKFNRIDSINYGGIGTVIGHEISHAFDANGRKYDHEGNLRNWWTKKTMRMFLSKARCFAKQYEDFEFDPEIQVDGNYTLSENIADNGGVRNAFKAFRLHLALSDEDMTHRKTLPGLPATPEQLFFLGYASIWCGSSTKEYMKREIEYDEHSPNKLRVNVPLANFKEFARAFKCNPGTPMNPSHKCVLW